MSKITLLDGIVHDISDDIQEALRSNEALIEKWNALTPLARNEWICWVTIVKKAETRAEHIKRLCEDIGNGKKRPCCWPGCPHRKPDRAKWFGKI